MKKSIYSPYLILCALLLVPVTACTTKTAAEKPQESPARQEQPAADVAPRTDDVPAQSAATETAAKTDSGSSQKKPQETTEKSDAVSGATIDSVSGATVSHGQKDTPTSDPAQQPPSPALAAADEQTASGTASASAPTHTDTAADKPVISGTLPASASEHSDTAAAAADQSIHSDTVDTPVPTASAETISPAAAAEQAPIAANTEADTPVPAPKQTPPDYETSLADLITDFENQGGSHGYEPPPTFHEEMLDLFSPQIFTVALSKEPETEPKVKVSRMVAVEEKQRVEIPYPGHGWVYVGEQTSQPGLKYEQRKLQDDNSIFMFTAEKRGDYVLHFSYFDVFTNEFVTDAVAVSVSAARSAVAKSTVKAPEYQGESDSDTAEADTAKVAQTPPQLSSSSDDIAAAVSAAQSTPGTAAPQNQRAGTLSANGTVGAATAETTDGSTGQAAAATTAEESLSSDQLLEKARTAIASADAGTALAYLDTFFTKAEQKLDEGWFLKGRAYELNGSARNIRLALDAYRTLTDTFPQSKFWAEADARIRYITGFYINIR